MRDVFPNWVLHCGYLAAIYEDRFSFVVDIEQTLFLMMFDPLEFADWKISFIVAGGKMSTNQASTP